MVDLEEENLNNEYKTKFLNDLVPGEEIEGKIHIDDIKRSEGYYQFLLTIENDGERWVCSMVTTYILEEDAIYAKKGDRVYEFIDSLNHIINGTLKNRENSYLVKFSVFKDNINRNVKLAKIKAVHSWEIGAKAVNLEVIDVKMEINEEEKIKSVAVKNNAIKLAYDSLKAKNKDINRKSVAFELKFILDNGEITREEFKDVLKELDKL